MKTKQERNEDSIKRIEHLKNETILRYTDEIEFDDGDLSLFDTMMEHFVKGDLDDVFLTDVTNDMSDGEKKKLFNLVREFNGLCFAKGDVDYWLDSNENAFVANFGMTALSIFDCYDYLLGLAKVGGRAVLEQLTALRENDELRNVAVIEYLRNSFVDDRVLTAILLDMSDENSFYDIFSNEQKGTLLNYPEGTLYSYGNGEIKIISPLILGCRLYNDYKGTFTDDLIGEINDDNLDDQMQRLSEFFKDDSFDFYDAVIGLSNRYRDYFRKANIVLSNEMMNVVYDEDGEAIQDAWDTGDEFLGRSYDTPYSGGTK